MFVPFLSTLSTTWFGHLDASGTTSESGGANSTYQYNSDATLAANGIWLTVSGSGSFVASGNDQLGYSGGVTYDHSIPNGDLTGTGSESETDSTSYTMQTVSAWDPTSQSCANLRGRESLS